MSVTVRLRWKKLPCVLPLRASSAVSPMSPSWETSCPTFAFLSPVTLVRVSTTIFSAIPISGSPFQSGCILP